LVTLSMTIEPRRVFVNVQVVVCPSTTVMAPIVPSLHELLVRSQPAGMISLML